MRLRFNYSNYGLSRNPLNPNLGLLANGIRHVVANFGVSQSLENCNASAANPTFIASLTFEKKNSGGLTPVARLARVPKTTPHPTFCPH